MGAHASLKLFRSAANKKNTPTEGRYDRCSAIKSGSGIRLEEGVRVMKNHRMPKKPRLPI